MDEEERKTRVITIATPEGAAYYPLGAWGRGYILDAAAQAAMDKYLRRVIWIVAPLWPLSSAVGRRLAADDAVSGFVSWCVFCAIHLSATWFILRDCPTATTRATPEDLLRRTLAQRGVPAVEASYWCILIIAASAMLIAALLMKSAVERWVLMAIGSAFAYIAARQLWRIKRLDVA